MQLVVVIVGLQPRNLVLPIRVEDVSIRPAESLRYLQSDRSANVMNLLVCLLLTFCQWPVNVSGGGAWP